TPGKVKGFPVERAKKERDSEQSRLRNPEHKRGKAYGDGRNQWPASGPGAAGQLCAGCAGREGGMVPPMRGVAAGAGLRGLPPAGVGGGSGLAPAGRVFGLVVWELPEPGGDFGG